MPTLLENRATTLATMMQEMVVDAGKMPSTYYSKLFTTEFSDKPVIKWDSLDFANYKAEDVKEGSQGITISEGNFTSEQVIPPYYKVKYNAPREFQGYLELSKLMSEGSEGAFLRSATEYILQLGKKTDMIKNDLERQAAQLMETGTVTTSRNGSYPFLRNAATIFDLGAGNYWNNNTIDPTIVIGNKLSEIAALNKFSGVTRWRGTIRGAGATAILNHPLIIDKLNKLNVNAGRIGGAATDAYWVAELKCGVHTVNLYVNEESYTDSTTQLPVYFSDEKKAVFIPEDPISKNIFVASNACIVKWDDNLNQHFMTALSGQQFYLSEMRNPYEQTHEWAVESKCLMLSKKANAILTLKVLA